MWPRIVETMLALWLAISPFVFGYGEGALAWWIVDFSVATVVVTASLLSYWPRARYAHLGTLAAALFLAGYGYFAGGQPSPPPQQNHLIVGLLLAMIAIIPSRNDEPPPKWARFYAEARDR